MKVLVVNNMAPFVWGGAEELAHHLVRNLNATPGVQAEALRVPFRWDPAERLLDEMLICRSMRLINVDRVIALKFPTYLVPHPNKVLWLLHQYRQAYDLWDAGQSNIPDTPRGQEIRRAIIAGDQRCFAEAQAIFTNSAVTRDRLRRYNDVDADVLMPPLNDPERFQNAGHGDYIFAGGRVNGSKRQHLLVEAMRLTRSGIRLVVGGPPDREADAERLRALVRDHGLEDRVTLDLGFLPRETLADYVNNALACAYLPVDEDSVGYVTMEAFHAGKAMLTVSDSGGLLEIVRDGETGIVVPPDAAMLADALDRLAGDRARTIAQGAAGADLWRRKNILWGNTVERLLA